MSNQIDDLKTGIIMALQEKADGLELEIHGLTSSVLKRMLISAIRFPRHVATTEVERDLVQKLFAIKDLQTELSILTIGQMQDRLEKEEQSQEVVNEEN